MFGKLVGAAGNLLAAIYLESMSRWLWLLVNMLPQNLTGGYLTYIMMTNSFIADNSTPRQSDNLINTCEIIKLFQRENDQIGCTGFYV